MRSKHTPRAVLAEFVVRGTVNGEVLDSETIPLDDLLLLLGNLKKLVYGRHRFGSDVREGLNIAISHGSVKLTLAATAAAALSLSTLTAPGGDLAEAVSGRKPADRVRRKALAKLVEWQTKSEDEISATIPRPGGSPLTGRLGQTAGETLPGAWADAEEYITAELIDIGGVRANIHLRLHDGTTILPFQYEDAIRCAGLISKRDGEPPEGVRRDAVKDDYKIIAPAATAPSHALLTARPYAAVSHRPRGFLTG